MSEKKETILSQLDELKTSVSQALDQIESLETETEELRSARREAEEKVWASEEEIKKISQEIDQIKSERDEHKSKIAELEESISSFETSKNEAVSELQRERDELKAEMDEITGKLTRVSELYREASAEKEKLQEKVDVSDLLAIYIMLLETVFYGKPHARILYMLHDTKAPISRKNIAQSSGIQPAVVQKAIFDLANADLVSYNDETQEVKLIKEIL